MVNVTLVEFPPSLSLSMHTAFGNADTDVPQVRLLIAVSGGFCEVGEGTTCVAADTAAAEPFLLLAVTSTRSVWPASPEETVYDEPFAPGIGPQFAPAVSQPSHWNA
jgi:hypothetical protein